MEQRVEKPHYAEKNVADGEFDKLIFLAEFYDDASFEKKKMIVNCLIKRVEVCRGYKLKVEFNIDFEQLWWVLIRWRN